jgi:hypothetical protein
MFDISGESTCSVRVYMWCCKAVTGACEALQLFSCRPRNWRGKNGKCKRGSTLVQKGQAYLSRKCRSARLEAQSFKPHQRPQMLQSKFRSNSTAPIKAISEMPSISICSALDTRVVAFCCTNLSFLCSSGFPCHESRSG